MIPAFRIALQYLIDSFFYYRNIVANFDIVAWHQNLNNRSRVTTAQVPYNCIGTIVKPRSKSGLQVVTIFSIAYVSFVPYYWVVKLYFFLRVIECVLDDEAKGAFLVLCILPSLPFRAFPKLDEQFAKQSPGGKSLLSLSATLLPRLSDQSTRLFSFPFR